MNEAKRELQSVFQKIIDKNHHGSTQSRLRYYVDYLMPKSRNIDFNAEAEKGKYFNLRLEAYLRYGGGQCQDYANALSFLCNMDGIPVGDVGTVIYRFGVEGGTTHCMNTIGRQVFGDMRFVDLGGMRGATKWDCNPEDYFAVSWKKIKSTNEKDWDWKFHPIVNGERKYSAFLKYNDHYKNSGGGGRLLKTL